MSSYIDYANDTCQCGYVGLVAVYPTGGNTCEDCILDHYANECPATCPICRYRASDMWEA
jgi:hypothetical protein